MAQELDDGEFWLPSHFLTDDDILLDLSPPFSNSHSSFGFGSGSSSDIGSLAESSDDDDPLLHSCPFPAKGCLMSTSPQSTLCGCFNQGSSRGSQSGPVSPPKDTLNDKKEKENATLDLLNKAAGEVAKIKLSNDSRTTGTGFFDCSNTTKRPLCPPPPSQPYFTPPFYAHHFHPLMWTPLPYQQQKQNLVPTKNTTNGKVNNIVTNTRPLGLPPSAWPPLTGQIQAHSQPQAQPMFVGSKRDSVGTGVFLPRRINTPSSDSRKKSDGNVMKTKNNKGSQRRNKKCHSTVKDDEIQLPSEWIY